jgi:hypothetical protein
MTHELVVTTTYPGNQVSVNAHCTCGKEIAGERVYPQFVSDVKFEAEVRHAEHVAEATATK